MRRLVDLRCYVAVNGNEYYDTSIHYNLHYVEVFDDEPVEYSYKTFRGAKEAIEDERVLNASIRHTFFRSQPVLYIRTAELAPDIKLTAKNFKSLKIKWVAEVPSKKLTIKDLASLLSAEDFAEWLKDHGISKADFD